jgi:peptide/nickel transport system permease protein
MTGDPAVLMTEPGAREEDLQAIRVEFGLDKPLWTQYGVFITRAVQGDFGTSIYYRIPAFELYVQRLPASLRLAAVSMAISLLIGLSVGILAAMRVGGWIDYLGGWFAILGLSLPNFWVGLMLILVFSVYLNLLPTSGAGGFQHMLMPASALGWSFAASHMRLARSAIVKHAFKNALIPVLTLAGINLVLMVNVAVVVESVFAWPGVGRLLYEGITFRDFPVVQTAVLMGGVMIIAVNLVVDLLYAYIDPRIRYG